MTDSKPKRKPQACEDWPPPNFATWLEVTWTRGIPAEFSHLSKRNDLPDTFESDDRFMDWLHDRGEYHLALNGARVMWRRFVNWRAAKTNPKTPRQTEWERAEARSARKDREDLIAIGLLPDPIERKKVFE